MPKVSRRTRKDRTGRLRPYGDFTARIRVPPDLAADFDAPELKRAWKMSDAIYGPPTLADMAAAMKRFPRHQL
jgi:hypothetical protein